VVERGVNEMACEKAEENDKGLIGKGIIFWKWGVLIHCGLAVPSTPTLY
jgi:hypothetical protein